MLFLFSSKIYKEFVIINFMEIRPRPTREIFTALCAGKDPSNGEDPKILGRQGYFLSCVHHGLLETPLGSIYPVLNLDEAVAFAASSWKSREQGDIKLRNCVDDFDLYKIFKYVLVIGNSWMGKYKYIPSEIKELHTGLNPFDGKTLDKRLETIDSEASDALLYGLRQPHKNYIFESEFHRMKKEQKDTSRSVILSSRNFQTFPRRHQIIPSYSAEITRIFGEFSREYDKTIERKRKKKISGQLELFT